MEHLFLCTFRDSLQMLYFTPKQRGLHTIINLSFLTFKITKLKSHPVGSYLGGAVATTLPTNHEYIVQ